MLGKNDYAKTKGFKPAIQGGLDYAFGDSGFYVGNWNSSVNWLKGNSIEMDVYGGYKFKAGPMDMDVGALTYIYPGNTSGNTTETLLGATYANETFGSFTAKYSHTVSKDYFGYAGNKARLGPEGHEHRLPEPGVQQGDRAQADAEGRCRLHLLSPATSSSLGYKDYLDYNVGVTYDFGSGLSLAGSVQGAQQEERVNLVGHPGIPTDRLRPFGQTTLLAEQVTRFILTLTKTL